MAQTSRPASRRVVPLVWRCPLWSGREARRRRGRRIVSVVQVAVVLSAGALAAAGCGYALAGRGSFLPAYIQTIGVPLFGNATAFYQIEQVVTEKVRSEFIGRGRYRVLPDRTGVDAVLEGQIVAVTVVPVSFTNQQLASRYVVTLVARVAFRDLVADKVLWENPSVTLREEYDVATGSGAADPTTFLGQNANALQRLAEDFARSVVSAILEAF